MATIDPKLRDRSVWIFLILSCLPFPGFANAGEVHTASSPDSLKEYIHKFESSYRAVQSLQAEFTQTYALGGRSRVESGIVYFARGGLMRWNYQQPTEKIFLSDGKKLFLYIPEEKQLTRSSVKASDDVRVPFRLLLSRINLSRVFSHLEFADAAWEHDPAHRVLRAYPKRGYEEDYREVLMELNPEFDIRRLRVIYPDQSIMEFRFDRVVRNPVLKPSLFKFTAPPGTEIIDQP